MALGREAMTTKKEFGGSKNKVMMRLLSSITHLLELTIGIQAIIKDQESLLREQLMMLSGGNVLSRNGSLQPKWFLKEFNLHGEIFITTMKIEN